MFEVLVIAFVVLAVYTCCRTQEYEEIERPIIYGPNRGESPVKKDVARNSTHVDGQSRALPTSGQKEKKEFISRGEAECGRVLAELFPDHKFEKVRPSWLMNDYPGRKFPPQPLELDFYCEELNLAVEFNGRQHYEFVPDFHKSEKHAFGQRARDRLKLELCRRRGVDVIVVRYDVPNIQHYLSSHPLLLKRL